MNILPYKSCITCRHNVGYLCAHPANDKVRIRSGDGTFTKNERSYYIGFARIHEDLCGEDAKWHSEKNHNRLIGVQITLIAGGAFSVGFLIGYFL